MIAIAVFIAVVGTVPAHIVFAAESTGSSASLSIAPKKTYVIDPGQSVKDKLTIRNLDSNSSLELTLRVVDFTFTNNGGTPKLFLAEDAPQTTWSLKPFLKVPDSVTIPPNGSKTLDMSVSVPAGHGAGSYYSAIIYSSGAPGSGGNVGLSASGVTLVFTQIPGQVNEDLKLEKFGLYNNSAQGDVDGYTMFTGNDPKKVAYTLKNGGNVTESPVGSITLKDLFGHETKINDVNPNGSLALIGQTRTFTSCIKLKSQNINFSGTATEATECDSPGLWPGYYSMSLDLYYGQNGNMTREVTGKSGFWYLPLWFIIVSIAVLSVLAWYIRKLVLAIQRKRHGGVKLGRTPPRRR